MALINIFVSDLFLNMLIHIVTYQGFEWLIKRVLDLMIEFIGPLYNWLQQFTNHHLTHCRLLPTGHSMGTSNWTPLCSVVLLQFWSELRLAVPSYNSSPRIPRKTPSSVVKNACSLVRYLAMDVLLLTAYAARMCLPSRWLAMGICVTILFSFSGGIGDFTLTSVNSGLGSAIHTFLHKALVLPAGIQPNCDLL
jgi:hypothetical protein